MVGTGPTLWISDCAAVEWLRKPWKTTEIGTFVSVAKWLMGSRLGEN